jgi:hypothetical protein
MLKLVGVLTWSLYTFLLAYQVAPSMSIQTSSQNPTHFNMEFLSRFKSQLAENLTAFFLQQLPLMCTTGASPPKALHGFVGGLTSGYSLVRGSNHAIWQLRKNQEIFRFESWSAFCFHRSRRPRVLVPTAPFFIF